jgi:hypothetical protein
VIIQEPPNTGPNLVLGIKNQNWNPLLKIKNPMLRALQSHAPNKRIYPRLVEYFLRQGYSKSMALLAFHRHSQSLVPSHSLFLAPLLWDYPHLGAFTLHFVYCELCSFCQNDKFMSPISVFVSSEFLLFFNKKIWEIFEKCVLLV